MVVEIVKDESILVETDGIIVVDAIIVMELPPDDDTDGDGEIHCNGVSEMACITACVCVAANDSVAEVDTLTGADTERVKTIELVGSAVRVVVVLLLILLLEENDKLAAFDGDTIGVPLSDGDEQLEGNTETDCNPLALIGDILSIGELLNEAVKEALDVVGTVFVIIATDGVDIAVDEKNKLTLEYPLEVEVVDNNALGERVVVVDVEALAEQLGTAESPDTKHIAQEGQITGKAEPMGQQ